MKYQNLRTTNYKEFNKDEIDAFLNKVSEAIKACTTSAFNLSYNTFDTALIISALFPIITDKRNKNKDRILNFYLIDITIKKASGYLDIRHSSKKTIYKFRDESYKDYQNTPEFQYQTFVDTNGMYIPYKCRNIKPFLLKSRYQYGTELNDIDFNTTFDDLFNNILK